MNVSDGFILEYLKCIMYLNYIFVFNIYFLPSYFEFYIYLSIQVNTSKDFRIMWEMKAPI